MSMQPRRFPFVLRISERCPRCAQELVLRRSKSGTTLVSCSRCVFREDYVARQEQLAARILELEDELRHRDRRRGAA